MRMSCSPLMAWITEPGPEEEQRLEEGVGHQVEDPGGESAHAEGQEHVAQLAHRGVGQHPLDVVLHQADGGGKDGGHPADHRHDQHGVGSQGEEHVAAHHHVDTGGDHGGGMDQGADRCGALHGVGQPDIERDLCRLAGGADKEQQGHEGDHAGAGGNGAGLAGQHHHLGKIKGAEDKEDQEGAEDEAHVTDTVDHEGLHPRLGRRVLLVEEADQKIRTEPHPLPAHKEQEEVVGQHQDQHGKGEEVEEGEVAGIAALVPHVADGVDVDQEAHPGDHQHHHHGQRVELQAEGDGDAVVADHPRVGRRRLDPHEVVVLEVAHLHPAQGGEGEDGHHQGDAHRRAADEADQFFGQFRAQQAVDQKADQRC